MKRTNDASDEVVQCCAITKKTKRAEEDEGGDEEAEGGAEEDEGGDEEAEGGDEEAEGGDEEDEGGDEGGAEEDEGGDEEDEEDEGTCIGCSEFVPDCCCPTCPGCEAKNPEGQRHAFCAEDCTTLKEWRAGKLDYCD